jgi:hypothetical protein
MPPLPVVALPAYRGWEGILKVAYNALKLQRDGIRVDSVGWICNPDGMGQGSGILREELGYLVNLHPIDPALHGT